MLLSGFFLFCCLSKTCFKLINFQYSCIIVDKSSDKVDKTGFSIVLMYTCQLFLLWDIVAAVMICASLIYAIVINCVFSRA